MLNIIIAGLLAYGIIKLIEKVQKRNDYVSTGAIVAACVVFAFFASTLVAYFKLPQWYLIICLPVYFVLPLLVLRKMWELSWGRSAAYAGIIFGCILFAEVGLQLLFTLLGYN